jgi:hypothetical protein
MIHSSVLQTGRVLDPTRGRVPGKIRRVGSGTGYKKKFGPGTNMIAYPDPDR